MGIETIDPLGDVTLGWLWRQGQALCTCPAKDNRAMLHGNACGLSKIWADIMAEYRFESPEIIALEFKSAENSIKHHIYTCAQCVAKRRAEDMVVIYEAPLYPSSQFHPPYKYPHNITKVVCCTHNRNGRVGYQRIMPNGY
jgi:hypothetical protein